jgi:hypothetical protein
MNAEEIRQRPATTLSETLLRETAAQLAEIKALLEEALKPAEPKGPPAPYVPHPADKRHQKKGAK